METFERPTLVACSVPTISVIHQRHDGRRGQDEGHHHGRDDGVVGEHPNTFGVHAPRPETILATSTHLVADQSIAIVALEANYRARPVAVIGLAAIDRFVQCWTSYSLCENKYF